MRLVVHAVDTGSIQGEKRSERQVLGMFNNNMEKNNYQYFFIFVQTMAFLSRKSQMLILLNL